VFADRCTLLAVEAVMRVVVAPRRDALLHRGQPVTAENQRENVRLACDRLTPIAEKHESIISRRNGPQIGLPALEEAAYKEMPESPLDVFGGRKLRA
jgi:carbamate kinase